MKKVIFLGILLLLVQSLFSQQREAKGYVINKLDNMLIQDAKVSVVSSEIFNYTDELGHFQIEVPKKHHFLMVTKPGFKSAKVHLIPGFKNITIRVELVPQAYYASVGDTNFINYKNVVTFAPLELIGGAFAIRYERFLKPRHSVGVHSSVYFYGRNVSSMGSEYNYYPVYQGVKLSPFYRFYPFRNNRRGLFAEVKFPFGYIHFSELDYHYTSSTHPRVKLEYSFWTYGFGASVGMMFKFPRKEHGVINISVGYQYFPIDVPETIQYPLHDKDGTVLTLPTDTRWWYWGGPGTSLDLKFTIGGIF